MVDSSAIWAFLRRLFGLLPLGGPGRERIEGVLGREEFWGALRLERWRADRIDMPICLIIASPADQANRRRGRSDELLSGLARVFADRVRCTDVVGWLERDQLGVILPHTPPGAAWNIIDDAHVMLEDRFGGRSLAGHVEYRVHVYPMEGSAGGPRVRQLPLFRPPAGARRRPAGTDHLAAPLEDLIEQGPATPAPKAPPGTGRVPGRAGTAIHDLEPAYTDLRGRAVLPLRPLMVSPLPSWKRAVDVVGSAVALVGLAPAFLLVAAAIKATSRGPILFRQRRVGLAGRPFAFYKFRSMVAEAEAMKSGLLSFNQDMAPGFKMEQDPRITPLGRFLRRWSIDELPQLWNVLKGDMSLVGPRPVTVEEAQASKLWYRRGFDVTPGITCFWQVGGRSELSFEQRMRLDMEYLQERSLWVDLRLLVLTLPAILSRKGAW